MIRRFTIKLSKHIETNYQVTQRLRNLSSQAGATDETLKEDHAAARRWLSKLNIHTIPRNLCEITFSRSSGPGGQNVNKVNSKATVRLSLKDLLPLVPNILHPHIKASRFFAERSQALVISADGSRRQGDNVEEAFAKLHDLITDAGKKSVRGETPPEQVIRVKKMQKAENEARLRLKKSHSSKKAARRGGSRSPSY